MFKRILFLLLPLFLWWSLYLVVAYSDNYTIDLQTTFYKLSLTTNDLYDSISSYFTDLKLMSFGLFSGVESIGLRYTGVHSLGDFFDNIQVFFSQIGFCFKFFFDFCGHYVFGAIKVLKSMLDFAFGIFRFLFFPSLKTFKSWY